MSLTQRLREYLESLPDMSATIAEASAALGVNSEQIYTAATSGDYWIMTGVYSDTGEAYVALEGE